MDFGHDRASIDGRILGGRLLQIKRLPERGHIIEFILVDQGKKPNDRRIQTDEIEPEREKAENSGEKCNQIFLSRPPWQCIRVEYRGKRCPTRYFLSVPAGDSTESTRRVHRLWGNTIFVGREHPGN
ncbi:hypothetical protein RUM44_003712 [Polyplax serrata]|uniref:Uncharacterized protein n=1 Tax=Polyplax serrata TaxID=468196 RepID=A0ABR1AH85_POLSC